MQIKNKNIIPSIFGACLYVLFVMFALIANKEAYILTQGLYMIILYFLAKLIFNKDDVYEKKYSLIGYIYLSLVGILLIWHHDVTYGSDFDKWGDDSWFFLQAQYYKTNLFESSYSGYEKLLAIVLIIFNFFNFDDDPSLLLPLNWMVAGLTIGLSYKLASKLVMKKLPFIFLFFSIFLNYTFVQNSVHLYRDIFVAFLSLLTILSILNNSYYKAFTFSTLTGMFRFPSGVFNLFLIGIKLLVEKKKNSIPLLGLFFLVFALVSMYAVNTNLKISKYEAGSIVSEISKRDDTFLSELEGGIALLYDLPEPIRFIANIPFQIIRPLTIKSAFQEDFDHRKFGNSITTLSMIFLLGYYARGVIIGLTSRNKNYRFFIYSLILYAIIIGYFSFLDRHRLILIPLFPALIALNLSDEKKHSIAGILLFNKKLLSALMIVVIVVGLLV